MEESLMELLIDNRQDRYEITDALIELINKAVEACLIYEGWEIDYEVSLSFVDNQEIQALNHTYRGKDYAQWTIFLHIGRGLIAIMGIRIRCGDTFKITGAIQSQSTTAQKAFNRSARYLST